MNKRDYDLHPLETSWWIKWLGEDELEGEIWVDRFIPCDDAPIQNSDRFDIDTMKERHEKLVWKFNSELCNIK